MSTRFARFAAISLIWIAASLPAAARAAPGPEGGVDARIAALEAEVAALRDLLSCVTKETAALHGLPGPHLILTGCNLHIRSGSGKTNAPPNGRGNLVVGYNEPPDDLEGEERTGSHNLIVGPQHKYPSYGAFLAGFQNTASGAHSSVGGGIRNVASGIYASVTGGLQNSASEIYSSLSGGTRRVAGSIFGPGGDGSGTAGD